MSRSTMRAFGASMMGLLAGCYGAPVSYVASTPTPTGEMYPCALRTVNELGYTLTSASRDGGLVIGEKQRAGLTQTLLGREDVDRLTLSIYDDTVPTRRKVHVTVSATRRSQTQEGTRITSIGPSDAATHDAATVLSTCAEGANAARS